MEEIKRYSREDINSMKKQFLLQDRRFIDMLDHKAVVETMQNKIDELEKENKSLEGANETMNIVINNMEDLGV